MSEGFGRSDAKLGDFYTEVGEIPLYSDKFLNLETDDDIRGRNIKYITTIVKPKYSKYPAGLISQLLDKFPKEVQTTHKYVYSYWNSNTRNWDYFLTKNQRDRQIGSIGYKKDQQTLSKMYEKKKEQEVYLEDTYKSGKITQQDYEKGLRQIDREFDRNLEDFERKLDLYGKKLLTLEEEEEEDNKKEEDWEKQKEFRRKYPPVDYIEILKFLSLGPLPRVSSDMVKRNPEYYQREYNKNYDFQQNTFKSTSEQSRLDGDSKREDDLKKNLAYYISKFSTLEKTLAHNDRNYGRLWKSVTSVN